MTRIVLLTAHVMEADSEAQEAALDAATTALKPFKMAGTTGQVTMFDLDDPANSNMAEILEDLKLPAAAESVRGLTCEPDP